ncbi:MAG: hypothetical protein PHC44_05800 [Lutispora sp.]|nr:hypothetical protein [Lutispora sp.]
MIIVIFSTAQIYIRILRRNLNTQKNTAAAAIDTANLIILGIDKEGIIYDFNRHAETKLGYKKANIVGSMKLESGVYSRPRGYRFLQQTDEACKRWNKFKRIGVVIKK